MINDKLKNYAIVLASGTGSRFGSSLPKQFEKIGEKTILELSLDIFEINSYINEIILVINPNYRDLALKIVENKYKKLLKILDGGETRKQSSFIGVNSIDEEDANVLIHDCARPLLSQNVLNNCISALKKYDAVDVARPITDTILVVNDSIIKSIPDRNVLHASQTPQCFKLSVIKKAHLLSSKDESFSDDCGLVLKYNPVEIHIVEGNVENIKITHPADLDYAKTLLNVK